MWSNGAPTEDSLRGCEKVQIAPNNTNIVKKIKFYVKLQLQFEKRVCKLVPLEKCALKKSAL